MTAAAPGTRYAVLLRGINVGGRHKLPMAELRSFLSERGYADVTTYIQSGNVALTTATPREALQRDLAVALAARFGFPVPTVAVARQNLLRIQAANPWADVANPKACHIFLFPHPVAAATRAKLEALTLSAPDALAVSAEAVYLHTPDGLLAHKSGDRVGRLAPEATARNLATVAKLVELTA